MSENLPDLTFLERLADVAARESLAWFRTDNGVENKLADGFDPVTEGDKRTEAALRAQISDSFPGHGILGEEYGGHALDSDCIWVIDPIDGTRAFISGVPVWGNLVGLKVNGRAHCGFIQQPYTGELFVADGNQALLIEQGDERSVLSTRKGIDLSQAIGFTTDPALYVGDAARGFERVQSQAKLMRFGTDCYGAAMVARGLADFWIEPDIQSYDVMGIIPVIEQAGGMISTIDGARAEDGGTIIAAGSAELHAQIMAVFNG